MMSKTDQKAVKMIDKRWNDFLHARRRKVFENSMEDSRFVSMLERESMITTLLNIYDKYKKNETIYEIS